MKKLSLQTLFCFDVSQKVRICGNSGVSYMERTLVEGKMDDEYKRVEARPSISGSGMQTDPERIRELEHEAERMERTWKEAPKEKFISVLDRTDAKGELVSDNVQAAQINARGEAHIRKPDPRIQALHSHFGSIPSMPVEVKPACGKKTDAENESIEILVLNDEKIQEEVTSPRENTQVLRFLAEAEQALHESESEFIASQKSRSHVSNSVPPTSYKRTSENREKKITAKKSQKNSNEAPAKKNRVLRGKFVAPNAKQKNNVGSKVSSGIRAGPAAVLLPENRQSPEGLHKKTRREPSEK